MADKAQIRGEKASGLPVALRGDAAWASAPEEAAQPGAASPGSSQEAGAKRSAPELLHQRGALVQEAPDPRSASPWHQQRVACRGRRARLPAVSGRRRHCDDQEQGLGLALSLWRPRQVLPKEQSLCGPPPCSRFCAQLVASPSRGSQPTWR